MATFEERVNGLSNIGTLSSSTYPTDVQLDQYLKDGVIDVTEKCIALMPLEVDSFTRVSATTDSNNSLDLNGAKILNVSREANSDGTADETIAWRPCRKISPALESRVVDPDSLEYASIYNPVYLITDNNKINVYPAPKANNGFKVYYINNDPVDNSGSALIHSHSTIQYFPDDKVHLVVIYAAIKCIEAKMYAMHLSIPNYGDEYTSSGTNTGWAYVKEAIELDDDVELGTSRFQSLSGEMQQFITEYQWYQGRAASLKSEYIAGFTANQPQPER
tara:strand:- start:2811 stop:3638 length:828 start_codon:yes stop_codon:yes gene_type:complete